MRDKPALLGFGGLDLGVFGPAGAVAAGDVVLRDGIRVGVVDAVLALVGAAVRLRRRAVSPLAAALPLALTAALAARPREVAQKLSCDGGRLAGHAHPRTPQRL